MEPITGKTLIDWGYKPDAWFKNAIQAAEAVRCSGGDEVAIRNAILPFLPPPTLPLRAKGGMPIRINLAPEGALETGNFNAVSAHMDELVRLPTVRGAAIMPDACPSGSEPGTIPVGGIVATENAIHPGMHSADICCSMAISILGDVDPHRVLDAGMKCSHFGGGGRAPGSELAPPKEILTAMEGNPFLENFLAPAVAHFGTQGDGNHFFYVGRMASSGKVALVTHHGSRKPGALLYKAGMAVAERFTKRLSPETPHHNSWIPFETPEGENYWKALQILRAWTKANHFAIHDAVAGGLKVRVEDRFWNEHNFVFRRNDGLFYHAKGATPAWADFAADSSGLAIIPLNMAEPVLIVRGRDARHGLGFAPHGAGRNHSRGQYLRTLQGRDAAEVVREQTRGLDIRFFSGHPDLSELPGAYKNAKAVKAQIERFALAEVVDQVEPVGCLMAGDWMIDAPWRKSKTP